MIQRSMHTQTPIVRCPAPLHWNQDCNGKPGFSGKGPRRPVQLCNGWRTPGAIKQQIINLIENEP
ncbi:hypothetical protein JZ751_021363 [Albula glossodonta]|uniref:Uncharacterized protein n=1 Tax=Albula glossodonta TaxID=121402 RepID=A0A8T2NN93_9TELE|nr:hypothetical protein JZ751_021363 [Albula glossodonta]